MCGFRLDSVARFSAGDDLAAWGGGGRPLAPTFVLVWRLLVGRECYQHVELEALPNILQGTGHTPQKSVIWSEVSGVPLRNPGGGAH